MNRIERDKLAARAALADTRTPAGVAQDGAAEKVGAALGGHTPGPWKAWNSFNGRTLAHWHIQSTAGKIGKPVATVSDLAGNADEQAAVARLIESAPDLLAALKDILDYAYAEEEQLAHLANHEPDVYGDAHAACQGAIRIARAAIVRAEGGEA